MGEVIDLVERLRSEGADEPPLSGPEFDLARKIIKFFEDEKVDTSNEAIVIMVIAITMLLQNKREILKVFRLVNATWGLLHPTKKGDR